MRRGDHCAADYGLPEAQRDDRARHSASDRRSRNKAAYRRREDAMACFNCLRRHGPDCKSLLHPRPHTEACADDF